ncbi:hypothetical protein T459_28814 [Capsicum annuum]|uniref:Uncharacterized protein n=1 Tax=Capsicum annuum TaxID=4072 RepID=A0A2G2YHW1_CAPAN|nr:hypothetical protein T459_28814 [Capsicum annuum]
MMVDNVLVVIGDAVSCDDGMVVSIDTVVSVEMMVVEVVTLVTVVVMVSEECVEVDDVLVVVSDMWKLMIRWWLLVVVLVLIDELVGSGDRPVAVDGSGVGGRGVHGSIWYLDDKSQIKAAVRMAEIGLTSAWMLDDFKVAISKYISSLPMSDTNLKVLHKISELSAKALVVLPCYVSLEVGQFVIAKLATRRIMGDEGLLLEIFNKFVNKLKEKERKRQEDKRCVLHVNRYIIMMISSMPALYLAREQILNDDDILDVIVVSCMSTDILNADDILDASVRVLLSACTCTQGR